MSVQEKKDTYKYCIVPGCKSTVIRNPDKRFLILPQERKRRNAWLRAARIDKRTYAKSTRVYLCEDHFNFEEDAENYVRMQYHESNRIVLKPNVVPHIFECQPERTTAQKPRSRPTSAKRARRFLVEGILKSGDTGPDQQSGSEDPSSGTNTPPSGISTPPLEPTTPPQHVSTQMDNRVLFSPRTKAAAEALCSLSKQVDTSDIPAKTIQSKGLGPVKRNQEDKWVQVKPDHSHKYVQHRPRFRSKFVQCNLSCAAETKTTASSPIKIPAKGPVRFALDENVGTTSPNANVYSSPSACSKSPASTKSPGSAKSPASSGSSKFKVSDSSSESDELYDEPKLKRELHLKAIKKDPMHFIGVPLDLYFLVNTFAECVGCLPVHILIILQKIRQDRTFKSIGYDFQVSESYASKIFSDHVSTLAKCLETFIVWPSKEEILSRLPVPFRARYFNVQSIIDCFEIEIEKPSDPVHQTLTFSNYKKCNTFKYEISMTPDGLINHLSIGLGGRTSDCKVIELGGFLDKLPAKCAVMADRGFKGIAPLLEKKGCTLVRPPSVKSDEKSTKDEVRESKRISSLRIHIERVIRRVREFEFVRPHACVNHNLVKYLDSIVVIVCGLVNLQNPVIRKYV